MSYFKTVQIDTNNATGGAFGRLRSQQPYTLFSSKQIHDNLPLLWDEQEVSGSGTSSTYTAIEAATTLSVSGATSGKRVRQTFERFNYQPGKSHLVMMTFSDFGTGVDVRKEVGYFDDLNGIFCRSVNGQLYMVIKSSVAGGPPIDTAIPQSNWNLDPLDGSGTSGITLDPSKSQILIIDFEWLGVGRVRTGFNIDGKVIYVHEFLNANNNDVVYMSTPNLPLRYSIENLGGGAADDFQVICSTVHSEGGVEPVGVTFSANLRNDIINANSVGTRYALNGLRLKSDHLGSKIKLQKFSIMARTDDDLLWELILNPSVTGGLGWVDQSNSSVQFGAPDTAGNPSTTTVAGGTILASGYIQGNRELTDGLDSARNLGVAIDGTRDEVVLCVTPLDINLDVTGSITWLEEL